MMTTTAAGGFLRRILLDDGASMDDTDGGEFDAGVFWGVNCFILVLLTGMCLWCCYFGRGKDTNLGIWSTRRVEADREYQRSLQSRHEERMAARRSTPAKRAARLKRSFQRHRVQMVVKVGDIVQDDETSRCGDDNMLDLHASSHETETTGGFSLNPSDIESGVIVDADITEDDAIEQGIEQVDEHLAQITPGQMETTDDSPQLAEPTPPLEEVATDSLEDAAAALELESCPDALKEGIVPASEEDEEPTNNTTDETIAGIDDTISLVSEHPTGYLVLRPGDTLSPPPLPHQKKVPNCCAVCLGAYDIGDTVVWSCNPECQHAFHHECVMEWLLKIQDGGTPCPCCRQEFTSWESDRQERKVKWAAGHTFDFGSVSF